jgi:hypothetical protein
MGYLYVANYNGVYRSTNEGSWWTFLDNGLEDYHLGYVFADNAGNIYCSTQKKDAYTHHLFHSSDMGEHWQLISGNLNITVYAMGFRDQTIYLFTNKGIWVNNNETGIYDSHQSIEFTLQQNYPNPFNPVTTIGYSVPLRSFVSVKIYDILGRETAVLVNEEKNPGSYEVNWNAASLPSGVFFCRLKTNDAMITRKMILMK